MTPRTDRSYTFARMIALTMVLVLTLTIASIAVARVDEFGGATFAAPYAPYTAGPVVPDTESRPYAPYTAGPVVPETKLDSRPYAPYTAGPVVPDSSVEPPVNPRIGNFLEY